MTKEQVREWVESAASAIWPGAGAVGWTDQDSEFFGRFATLVGNAKLEEAADVVDNADTPDCGGWNASGIADAIRAMKEPTT